MKKILEKIYQKFVFKSIFELNTSEKDFINHFNKNVDYEKLRFFDSPDKKKSQNKYIGNILGNNFKLISYSVNSNFIAPIKGKCITNDKKTIILYEINGLKSINILFILIMLFSIITNQILFFYEKFWFAYILFNTFFYFFFKFILSEILKEIDRVKVNFEIDVKNWFRI